MIYLQGEEWTSKTILLNSFKVDFVLPQFCQKLSMTVIRRTCRAGFEDTNSVEREVYGGRRVVVTYERTDERTDGRMMRTERRMDGQIEEQRE